MKVKKSEKSKLKKVHKEARDVIGKVPGSKAHRNIKKYNRKVKKREEFIDEVHRDIKESSKE